MFRHLILILFLLGAPALCQTPPKVFQKLDYAAASKLAQEKGCWLLVDATASWCPPCHKMDATTWVDPAFESFAEGHLVPIQIDVDEQAELAEKLGISAMPTVIVFADGKELDRSVGYKTTQELLAWLSDLQSGKTQADRLREKAATGDIDSRYDLAGVLMSAGKVGEAEELYLQLWTDMAADPSWGGVRYSYLLSDLEQLAEQSSSAKERLEKFRAEADEKGQLEDWFFLSKILGHDDELLAWQAPKPLPPSVEKYYFQYLAEHEEWAKAGNLIDDPAAHAAQVLKLRARVIESAPDDMAEQLTEYANQTARADLLDLYRACLAAGRIEEARAVRAVALEDDPELRSSFEQLDQESNAKP